MTPDDAMRLRDRLTELGTALVGIDAAVMRPVVDRHADTADDPLRIAVVGRVKAGKSTLVNAVVGRRVAPTDEAECTRIVTHYRYGGPERAVLHLLDGSSHRLESTRDQLLPDVLPVPVEVVSHAEVFVQEAALRDRVLIDTPGLGSRIEGVSEATRRAVLQTRDADVLLYVVRDTVLADDAVFLTEFTASGAGREGTAAAVGVLSHADAFGDSPWDEDDPIAAARRYADRQQERHRAELDAIVPFAGLLAEAVATGRITDADVRLLAALDDVDEDLLQEQLDLPATVAPEAIDELAARIGWYGIARGRAPAAAGTAELLSWAERSGGRGPLEEHLRGLSVGRHRQLRAARTLRALELAADASEERDRLLAAIAEAAIAPELQPVRLLRAWAALRAAHPASPMLRDLGRVLDADDDRGALGLASSTRREEVLRAAEARTDAAHQAALYAESSGEEVAARALTDAYERIGKRWRWPGT